MNSYGYVKGDPTNLTDPLGTETCGYLTGSRVKRCGASLDAWASWLGLRPRGLSAAEADAQGKGGDFGGGFGLSRIEACVADVAMCLGSSLSQPVKPGGNMPSDVGTIAPLTPSEDRIVGALLGDSLMQSRMATAWTRTLLENREHGFFVQLLSAIGNRYEFRISQIYHGEELSMGKDWPLHATYLAASERGVYLTYHTHPGTWWASGFPSTDDAFFNRRTRSIGLIETRFGRIGGR